ncbi:MAG: peptide deformylase [Myxococcota bacterium]
MAVRPIITIGHPALRRPARRVEPNELGSSAIQQLIDDLIETMRDARGAGLAAPQIDESLQICAIEVGDNPRYPYKPDIPLTVLINPELTVSSESSDDTLAQTFDNYEGCLSVPDIRGLVRRHCEVRIHAADRHGKPLDFEIRGLSAGTFQHEVDHLHGVLFLDKVVDTKSLCTWDNFERYHEQAFAEIADDLVRRWGS